MALNNVMRLDGFKDTCLYSWIFFPNSPKYLYNPRTLALNLTTKFAQFVKLFSIISLELGAIFKEKLDDKKNSILKYDRPSILNLQSTNQLRFQNVSRYVF